MKVHDIFIDTYKELESVVREQYENVRAYEEQLPDEDSKKMQICRLIRNYIQHNTDYEKFLHITPCMQSFLEQQVYSIKCMNGILKDNMMSVTKYGCLFSIDDTVVDCAQKMTKKKRDFGIVVDKKNTVLGLFTKTTLCSVVSNSILTKSLRLSKIKDMLSDDYVLKYLDATTPMDTIAKDIAVQPSMIFVVTNKAGTITGLYNV